MTVQLQTREGPIQPWITSHEADPYDVVFPQFPLSTASQMICGRVQRSGGRPHGPLPLVRMGQQLAPRRAATDTQSGSFRSEPSKEQQ